MRKPPPPGDWGEGWSQGDTGLPDGQGSLTPLASTQSRCAIKTSEYDT